MFGLKVRKKETYVEIRDLDHLAKEGIRLGGYPIIPTNDV